MIVTSVAEEPIDAITDAEAALEGFENREAFFLKWVRLYGGDFDPEQPVWRIEFELARKIEESG